MSRALPAAIAAPQEKVRRFSAAFFSSCFSLLRYQKEREIVRHISVRTGGSE